MSGPQPPAPAGRGHVAVLTTGLGLYLFVLWFGMAVVGDTALHSAVMAALILALAGTGYFRSRRAPARDE